MTTTSIDTTHSEIGFTVRHMVFAKVRGQFKSWSATLAFDASDPSKSAVTAEIDVASIDTREDKRDGHLRSPDFFDAEKFPKMTFQSTRVAKAGDGRFTLTGALTLHGVTKEVTLDVEQTGAGKDPWGNQRLGFSAKGTLLRSEFGLTWNQTLETGGLLVSDKIDLDIDVEVIAAG